MLNFVDDVRKFILKYQIFYILKEYIIYLFNNTFIK